MRKHAVLSADRKSVLPLKAVWVTAVIALALRFIDIFVFKIDELWGEIIISKTLGFTLVLLCLYAVKKTPAAIDLCGRRLALCIGAGVAVNLGIYLFAYGAEFTLLVKAGQNPGFVFSPIDPKRVYAAVRCSRFGSSAETA